MPTTPEDFGFPTYGEDDIPFGFEDGVGDVIAEDGCTIESLDIDENVTVARIPNEVGNEISKRLYNQQGKFKVGVYPHGTIGLPGAVLGGTTTLENFTPAAGLLLVTAKTARRTSTTFKKTEVSGEFSPLIV